MKDKKNAIKDKKNAAAHAEPEPMDVIAIKEQPKTQQVVWIELEKLIPHPANPRGEITEDSVKGLATTIKEKGVEQPLKVVPIRSADRKWKIVAYRIIIGHRRRVACEVAGLSAAPCIIEEMDETTQRRTMLVENLQREDLTPLQEAQGYKLMLEDGHIQSDIARMTGMEPWRIGNRLAIFKFPAALQTLFNSHDMPTTAIPLLHKIENLDRQARLAQMIAERKLTVPKLKAMIKREEEGAEAGGTGVGQSADGAKEKAGKSAKGITGWPRDERADALRAIREMDGEAVRWDAVGKAMESTCAGCDLTNRPVCCERCPLPAMIGSMIKGSGHE